jgi:hypothetical protein
MNEKLNNIFISGLLCIAMLVWASGCVPTVQTKYIQIELQHDPRPVLPSIGSEELSCLTQGTVQKLYDRQRLITSYAITLETIIDSTNK